MIIANEKDSSCGVSENDSKDSEYLVYPERWNEYGRGGCLSASLEAVEDARRHRNLYGPYQNADDAVNAMLED